MNMWLSEVWETGRGQRWGARKRRPPGRLRRRSSALEAGRGHGSWGLETSHGDPTNIQEVFCRDSEIGFSIPIQVY